MDRNYKYGDILTSDPYFGGGDNHFLIFHKRLTPGQGLTGNRFDLIGTMVFIYDDKIAIHENYETYSHFYIPANQNQIDRFVGRLEKDNYHITNGELVRDDIKSMDELIFELKSVITDKRILKAIDQFLNNSN